MSVIVPKLIYQGCFPVMSIIHWGNIEHGDTCAPYDTIGFTGKDVDINGIADSGAIAIHGANHPNVPVYSVVKDRGDNEISGRTRGHYTVRNHVHSLKPVLTGGGEKTKFNVTMILYG